MTPTRPALRYHGGKWRLAPWVISHFPPHRVYVEAFGGAASVLLQKPRVQAEIYNDLDDEVVNLFRVLRDPAMAAELKRMVELTPFAREELRAAYDLANGAVDGAHKALIRSFMGFGSAAMTRARMTGFRSSSFRSEGRKNTTPAIDWMHWPDHLSEIVARLRGVVIEHRDFAQVIAQHDAPYTLIYADPPYVPVTRRGLSGRNGNGERKDTQPGTSGRWYRHDMTDGCHARLAGVLRAAKGMVVLSGYPSPLYDELYSDWHRFERKHYADSARPRTEVLWINEACSKALAGSRSQMVLVA